LTKWSNSKIGVHSVEFWSRTVDQLLSETLTALIIFLYVIRGNSIVDLPLLLYWVISLDFLAEGLTGSIFWYIGEYSKSERIFEITNVPQEKDEFSLPEETQVQLETAQSEESVEISLSGQEGIQTKQVEQTQVSSVTGVSITLKKLNVRIAEQPILTGVDCDIEAGSHIAVVGPSGAGKSTLVGTLMGWHYSTGGQIRWISLELQKIAKIAPGDSLG